MNRHYQWEGDNLILQCQLQPRAATNEVAGVVVGTDAGTHSDRLKIRITAPPVDGKANKHLIALLSKWFGTAKGNISILRGETGRQKTLLIKHPSRLLKETGIIDKGAA